jgi:hypothetical protein
MDIDNFIVETLRQVVKGVQAASDHQDCKGAKINPQFDAEGRPAISQVEFDVAVTVTEGSEKQGKANIGVAWFGVGGQANSTTANTSISRIKFAVPVMLPTK